MFANIPEMFLLGLNWSTKEEECQKVPLSKAVHVSSALIMSTCISGHVTSV